MLRALLWLTAYPNIIPLSKIADETYMIKHAGRRKIVFSTWGSYGDLHPYMALALEMQNRGHDCLIATSSIYQEKVEAAGLGFHPVRPDLPPPDSDEARNMIRRVSNDITGPAYLFRELLMPHLRAAYEDTLSAVTAEGGADLLVSHQVPLAAPIVADVTGIKWISCVLFPIAFGSVYDPPTPPQLPAIRSLIAAHPLIASPLMAIGKWTMRPWVEPVQDLRLELGLKRSPHPIFEGQHSPLRVFALFSKLLSSMQRDFPANTMIMGFPFYDHVPEAPPAGLDEFLAAGEPPIVFTLGSSLVWNAGDFYRTSIEVADRLGRRALLLVGDRRNLPEDISQEGVAVFEYLPHHLVMPGACVNVHQGGIGTTGQALRAGRPMLVVPHGQDQPDNARRCVQLGVARSIPRRSYGVEKVVHEIQLLLDDPNYSRQAIQASRIVTEENGTRSACDEIERQLA